MAFTQETFAPVGPQSTQAPTIYSYSTGDNLAAVKGTAYFDDKKYQLEDGDVLLAQCSDGFAILEVSGTDGSVISPELTGSVDSTVISNKADVLTNGVLVGDEITLNEGNYYFENVDLGTDVIILPGGSIIKGGTATLSQITTNSTKPTITVKNGGNKLAAIYGDGGLRVNNSGTGAAIRAQDTDTICSITRLLTTDAGNVLEINDASVLLDSWTCLNATNGVVMTGTSNSGPILANFNPLGLTGKGIFINGDITSGALRINDAILGTTAAPISDNAIEIASGVTIQGMSFSGDAISDTGNGIKIAGDVDGGLSLDKTNILSLQNDGMDITGSTMSSFVATAAGITAIAAGKFGLVGDAASANITTGAGIATSSFIDGLGAGGGALSGIQKTDSKWTFTLAGPKITDSTKLGVFTLDASATTTITYQGFDGSIVAFSDPGGGVNTTVDIGAHSFVNGTPVSIRGTVAYNGLYTMANVTATTFDIVRTFVTAEVVGTYETGWTKIAGSTTAGPLNERYTLTDDNELRSDSTKSIPVIYTGVISGRKASGGTAEEYDFGIFKDPGDGTFVKVNGSFIVDLTNRDSEVFVRAPAEAETLSKFTVYVRAVDSTIDFVADTLTIDVVRT